MAKWCQLGFQGSLLAAFIAEPIMPQTIVVGNSQTSLESLNRALFTRFDLDNQNVTLAKTELNFHHDKDELSCDASLFWNPLTNGVIVQGRKQGCVKKHYGTAKAESPLCRKRIASSFAKLFCSSNNENSTSQNNFISFSVKKEQTEKPTISCRILK